MPNADVKLPRSIKKFIRREKARIRQAFLDEGERQQKILELYRRFIKE